MEFPEMQKIIESEEAYDFVAQYNFPIHGGGYKATRELLDMCQLDEKSRVLDVGCGPGHAACLIAEQYGSRVMGIDLSENMIAQARKRARKQKLEDKVEFQVANAFQLPFEDDSFDVVIFESVLTPIPDEKKMLNELMRVIRPGGFVGANEGIFDVSTPTEVLEQLAQHPSFSGKVITSESLKGMFEETGLQVIQFIEATFEMNALKEMGARGILSFMIRVYPKLVYKLLTDSRFRKYNKLDEEVRKVAKNHSKCALIVGKKPD
ncbi:MAG: class I SAM-dependent methyltransferase [Candidatus Hodarchaeales archaeon]|jgi:ubiquinone/menaquinone biosynthesis C-methylase UbiE